MKYFKHFCDMHRGRSINDLLDQLGHTGLCFFLLQEMCAEKLEKPSEGEKPLDESAMTFQFHPRIVRQNLRISRVNLLRLLDVCAANGLLSYEFTEMSLKISMPILLNLLDRDSKKARQTRADASAKSRLDKDKDKERDKDKEEELEKEVSGSVSPMPIREKNDEDKKLNSLIWESYRSAYLLRYQVEPVRNAKINSLVANLRKRLGEDAIAVVAFFVGSHNTYYLQRTHALDCCLRDAESLHVQWQKGKAITTRDVKEFEKRAVMSETWQAIKDGKI